MQRQFLWIGFVLVSLFLAACGGSEPPPTPTAAPVAAAPADAAAVIDVVMHDIYFGDAPDNIENPPVWTVAAGAPFTINLENKGGLEHNWTALKPGVEPPMPFLPDQHGDLVLLTSSTVPPGQQLSETLTAPTEPGEYIVICTIAGHYPAMQGRLVVTP